MERTAIVLGRAVLVSEASQLTVAKRGSTTAVYLLGGRGFCLSLRARLRAIGSKDFAASAEGNASKEDVGSTFASTVDDALRRKRGRAASTAGLASREKSAAARNGSSRRAMWPSIECGARARWGRRPGVRSTLSLRLSVKSLGQGTGVGG